MQAALCVFLATPPPFQLDYLNLLLGFHFFLCLAKTEEPIASSPYLHLGCHIGKNRNDPWI